MSLNLDRLATVNTFQRRSRNLNPESEVFMARIFQIWVSHFRSFGPGSKNRQISDETNRREQGKQKQLWDGFEGQTKAVDLGGTEEDMRKRIQTAIKQTGEEEVCDKSGEKGDLAKCGGDGRWESG